MLVLIRYGKGRAVDERIWVRKRRKRERGGKEKAKIFSFFCSETETENVSNFGMTAARLVVTET